MYDVLDGKTKNRHVFGLYSEMLCSDGKAQGEEKYSETGYGNEGKRRKEEAGEKECWVSPKDREKGKRAGEEERQERQEEGKKETKREEMKQGRKYLTKNKILHMVATYLTIINFAYEFNFISAVV